MRLHNFDFKRPEYTAVECITFKQQLESLEQGSDILDDHRNNNFQVSSEDGLKDALENPMGLVFISRLETGPDFHNPLFSNVAERLGLDSEFNPIVSGNDE